MRRLARKDKNHSAIVEALRYAGCSVLDLSQLGRGVPDILVGRNGSDQLVEIKSLDDRMKMSSGAERSLARQIAWSNMWRGKPVRIVSTASEALNAVGVLTAGIRGH